WNVDRRLTFMAEDGVDIQVLSPMPELLSYWFNVEETVVMGRHIAQTLRNMIDRAPANFYGLGMVPLQDPDRAAKELEVLKRDYGLHGVQIGTHVMGKDLGDPCFKVFFAAAAELGMAIFVHGLQPVGEERWGANPLMGGLLGYPIDSAIAAASLINGQVMKSHPALRLGFSHGGGSAMTVVNRLQKVWKSAPQMAAAMPEAPLETARRFYYDTLVYEPALLRAVREMFGAGQLMVGTDDPFPIRQQKPGEFLRECGIAGAELDAILGGNALRFLGIAG
ncbi:MAG: amidohydrolase family protein, partial [Alphaproteobacteria bacterium]|nr:amidohydrolase family protein [Alphaproteobacteria bacterium]